jgi:hypothetical protein
MVSNDVKGIAAKPHHLGLNGINGLRRFCKTACWRSPPRSMSGIRALILTTSTSNRCE